MTLHAAIVRIAESQLNVREVGGNNLGPDVAKYQKSTNIAPGAWPWCSAFVTWVIDQACIASGITVPVYRGGLAYDWEKHGKQNGWILLDENNPEKPGDLVTYDFSHIGIVTSNNKKSISTIEGNTCPKGSRDSETGDGVWNMVRARHLVKSFIRIPT